MLSTRQLPALKDRILISSDTRSVDLPVKNNNRPCSYKSWSEDNVYKAFLLHTEEGVSVRRAAEMFGIPKSTLQDRVSGKVPFGKKSGPTKFLTDEEEMELVDFLCGCASVGYAKSKLQVLSLVRSIVQNKGIDARVTDGWWTSFKKRHGQLTLRAAEPLSYARAVSSSPQIVSRYYDLLEKTLHDNDLMDKPSQLFNMDETGMPLDPSPTKIVTVRGVKHPTSVTTGNKSQITIVSACSASGYVLQPMVIFDRKVLKPELTFGEVPGTLYGLSKNGWIDSELFKLWFTHHFRVSIPPLRPILLILDGHSTHYQPSIVRLAASEKVILFCLPPNTTHLTQPLDKGCFSSLKYSWRRTCHTFLSEHPGRVVTRYDFSRLFSKAWYESMTQVNAISGFRCTGIYPFNRDAIQPSITVAIDTTLEKQSGLNFIPLYTCSPSIRTRNFEEEEEEDVPLMICRLTSVTKSLAKLDMPPSIKVPEERLKNCGRVLTSIENIKILQKKEQEKIEIKVNQEKKRLARLEKQAAKQSSKQSSKAPLTPYKTPIRSNSYTSSNIDCTVFTDKEWSVYKKRIEEGYDLLPTGRYTKWLKIYHPEILNVRDSDSLSLNSDSESCTESLQSEVEELCSINNQKQNIKRLSKIPGPNKNKEDDDVTLRRNKSGRIIERDTIKQNNDVCSKRKAGTTTKGNVSSASNIDRTVFTDKEWSVYEKRIEEGYDLPPTGRYTKWLKIYHPEILNVRDSDSLSLNSDSESCTKSLQSEVEELCSINNQKQNIKRLSKIPGPNKNKEDDNDVTLRRNKSGRIIERDTIKQNNDVCSKRKTGTTTKGNVSSGPNKIIEDDNDVTLRSGRNIQRDTIKQNNDVCSKRKTGTTTKGNVSSGPNKIIEDDSDVTLRSGRNIQRDTIKQNNDVCSKEKQVLLLNEMCHQVPTRL